jgi:O-antigen/teichoic acid export membrane protein
MDAAKTIVRRIWRHFMRDSLYRNSVFLMINMGQTAFFGFLFWTMNARLFPSETVGYATALVSAGALASSLATLGLHRTLLRFLARDEKPQRMLGTALGLTVLSSVLSAGVVMFLLPGLDTIEWTAFLRFLFVVIVAGIAIKNLLDNTFIAHRSAGNAVLTNAIAYGVRLVVPPLVIAAGFAGIVAAQAVCAATGVLAGMVLLRWRHGYSLRFRLSLRTMRDKWRFSFGSYAADVIGGLPALVLPIVITASIGPATGAYWYMAVMIATLVFSLGTAISQSFFAEISHDEQSFMRHARKAAMATVGVMLPIAGILYVCAPMVLSIFGTEYAAAASALRLLLLSSIAVAGNYVAGSIISFYKHVGYLTGVNMVNAALVIGLTYTIAESLQTVGVIWLVGEVVNILLFGMGALFLLHTHGLLSLSRQPRKWS